MSAFLSNGLRRLVERRRARRLVSPESLPVSEYLERFPGQWHVVRAAERLRWPAPRRFGSRKIEFDLPSVTSEFGVLEIQEGRVFGTHGWVIGANGAVLPELSWYGGQHERIRIPRHLPAPTRLSGRCLSLVSDWLHYGYLAGASQGERVAGTFGPSPYDFDVDPGELAAALDELTAA
jgi:hypothetical protein